MAHFACICPPYAGHINPMAAVADILCARAHQVTFLHIADVAPMATRIGHEFRALGASTHPAGWLKDAAYRSGRVRGMIGIRTVVQDMAGTTAMLCRELPAALRAIGADMIVADQTEGAGGLVAHHMGLPYVSIAAALPINWDPSVPSPFVGSAHGTMRWHRARNSALAFAARQALAPIGDVLAATSAQWRLELGRNLEHYLSGYAQISQLVPGLDFPREVLAECFHYCGPLRGASSETEAGRDKTGRAFASLGSQQGHRIALFERIAKAAMANGLDLTIAHGGLLSPPEVERLSRRAEVHAFVAQDRVLARSEIAILHGGLNTVLDAMAQGVPVIVIPLAYEQGAIAARVARAGVGRVRGMSPLPERRLAALIRAVRADPSYALAAAGIQREIRAAGGAARAADIIEAVLRTGRPVLPGDLANLGARHIAPA